MSHPRGTLPWNFRRISPFSVIVIFAAIKPRFRTILGVGQQEKSGAQRRKKATSQPRIFHFSTVTQLMARGPRLRLRTWRMSWLYIVLLGLEKERDGVCAIWIVKTPVKRS